MRCGINDGRVALTRSQGHPENLRFYGLSGFDPPRHAVPGVPAGAPPENCDAGVWTNVVPGPTKSFNPLNAQIEFACAGAAVSFVFGAPPGPFTSPANAAPPASAAATAAITNSRLILTLSFLFVDKSTDDTHDEKKH
jgi:hypothetical protein